MKKLSYQEGLVGAPIFNDVGQIIGFEGGTDFPEPISVIDFLGSMVQLRKESGSSDRELSPQEVSIIMAIKDGRVPESALTQPQDVSQNQSPETSMYGQNSSFPTSVAQNVTRAPSEQSVSDANALYKKYGDTIFTKPQEEMTVGEAYDILMTRYGKNPQQDASSEVRPLGGAGGATPNYEELKTKVREIAAEKNLPASVMLGMLAAEGRDKGLGAGRNNFYNIAAFDSNPDAAFRYETPEEGIRAFADFISGQSDKHASPAVKQKFQKAYSEYLKTGDDRKYILDIQDAGYAGDPSTYDRRSPNSYRSYSDFVTDTPEWKEGQTKGALARSNKPQITPTPTQRIKPAEEVVNKTSNPLRFNQATLEKIRKDDERVKRLQEESRERYKKYDETLKKKNQEVQKLSKRAGYSDYNKAGTVEKAFIAATRPYTNAAGDIFNYLSKIGKKT